VSPPIQSSRDRYDECAHEGIDGVTFSDIQKVNDD
jgi:hypothetical protein